MQQTRLQVGGAQQLALYDYNDPFCRQRFPDDKKYILDHYFQKLRHFPESLHTNFSKQLATERLLFLEQFIAQLAIEI